MVIQITLLRVTARWWQEDKEEEEKEPPYLKSFLSPTRWQLGRINLSIVYMCIYIYTYVQLRTHNSIIKNLVRCKIQAIPKTKFTPKNPCEIPQVSVSTSSKSHRRFGATRWCPLLPCWLISPVDFSPRIRFHTWRFQPPGFHRAFTGNLGNNYMDWGNKEKWYYKKKKKRNKNHGRYTILN